MLIAVGKIVISLLSAYAVVFFSFPLRMAFFWMIFITLMLPVEVRILPTYKVVADLGMLDSYAGLTIPLIASATATLLFRQFFLTIPDELVEAAKIDGAGPLRFLRDMVLPLSRTNIAALFVILFIYGWNQYLWPLLITTSGSMETVIVGIKRMMGGADADTDWGAVMATTMLAMLPPVAVVMLMQRWFVKGLVTRRSSDGDGQSARRAQELRRDGGAARHRLRDRRRRARRHRRPVGLRQVDPAAHHRRARDHHGRRDLDR